MAVLERKERKEERRRIRASQAELDAKLELSRKYEQAGHAWRMCLDNNLGVNIRNIVRRELQNTLSEFNAQGENDKVSLLNQLAIGLGLSEQGSEALHQETASGAFFEYSLEPYHQTQNGRRLSTVARLLTEVVGDITLGRSEEQRAKFRNDIIKAEELRGLPSVSLNETLLPIAKWLSDPSRSVPQSPRPS